MTRRSGKPIQVYLEVNVQAGLELLAKENGRTISAEVRRAIARYLENPERVTDPSREEREAANGR